VAGKEYFSLFHVFQKSGLEPIEPPIL